MFPELVKKRRSVRSYAEKPVEKEKILACLEAARLSPSAINAQPWRYHVVLEEEKKRRIADACNRTASNKFLYEAPVLIAIELLNPPLSRIGSLMQNTRYNLVDMGLSAAHFCLQAAELGLGTCMVGLFSRKHIQRTLNLPSAEIGLVISLGYPLEENMKDKKRKEMAKMATFYE